MEFLLKVQVHQIQSLSAEPRANRTAGEVFWSTKLFWSFKAKQQLHPQNPPERSKTDLKIFSLAADVSRVQIKSFQIKFGSQASRDLDYAGLEAFYIFLFHHSFHILVPVSFNCLGECCNAVLL